MTEVLLTAQKLLNNPTELPQLQPSSLFFYCSEAATGLLVSPEGARLKVTGRVMFGGFSSQVKQRVCVCVWLICFRVQLEGCNTRGIPLLTLPLATSLPDVEKNLCKDFRIGVFLRGEISKVQELLRCSRTERDDLQQTFK